MPWMYTRAVRKVSIHVIWKLETFIKKGTKWKKHCTKENDASVLFKVGTLVPHTVLPVSLPLFKILSLNRHQLVICSWTSSTVWNVFFLKGDFSFWKSDKLQRSKSRRCINGVDLKSFSKYVNTKQEADSVATFIFNTEDSLDWFLTVQKLESQFTLMSIVILNSREIYSFKFCGLTHQFCDFMFYREKKNIYIYIYIIASRN